eukprot:g8787.t1
MRAFLALAFPSWVLLGTASPIAETPEFIEAAPARIDDLVHSPSGTGCGEAWRTWPTVQHDAVKRGTVMVFDLVSRVGNAFLDLRGVIEICRWLELGLVVDWRGFRGFREAFDPGELAWDIDPAPFRLRAIEISRGIKSTGLHEFRFVDGAMILSDQQVTLLASGMGIVDQSPEEMAAQMKAAFPLKIRYWVGSVMQLGVPVEPCTWNMAFRRSPSMMKSLEEHHRPWAKAALATPEQPSTPPGSVKYVAWQIRTTDGESATSYKPKVHNYIFDHVPSTEVCRWYFAATEEALGACRSGSGVDSMPIFVSSNSKSMARNCSADAGQRNMQAGYVDLGVTDGNAHTSFSADPEKTARNAFVDFLLLLDAEVVIRTGSSFSGMAVDMKGLICSVASVAVETPVRSMYVCVPPTGC